VKQDILAVFFRPFLKFIAAPRTAGYVDIFLRTYCMVAPLVSGRAGNTNYLAQSAFPSLLLPNLRATQVKGVGVGNFTLVKAKVQP